MNVHQERGIAFFKNGDYHRAIEHFDRAIGYAESVNLLVIRSSCRLNLNDLKPALADAKAAIQLNREDSRGYIMAGDILIEMDRSSVALEVCASGLKRVPHIGAGFEALKTKHDGLQQKLSPSKSADPLSRFPKELAEQVLEYLTFSQLVGASRVSREWCKFIRSCHKLWNDLDLSAAKKRVRNTFVSRALNNSRHKITSATITQPWDFEKSLAAILKFCPIEHLTLLDCGLIQSRNFVSSMKTAKHLKSLKFSTQNMTETIAVGMILNEVSETIEIFETDILTSKMLSSFREQCKHLRVLKTITNTTDDTVQVLHAVNRGMKNIETLHVRETPQLHGWGPAASINLAALGKLRDLRVVVPRLHIDTMLLPSSIVVLHIETPRALDGGWGPLVAWTPPYFFLPALQELTLAFPGWAAQQALNMLGPASGPANTPEPPPPTPLPALAPLRALSLPSPVNDDDVRGSLLALLQHQRLPALASLALPSQPVGDDDVAALLERQSGLRSLDLSGTRVSGVAVRGVLARAPGLEVLLLRDCAELGRDAVEWARGQGVRVELGAVPKAGASGARRVVL